MEELTSEITHNFNISAPGPCCLHLTNDELLLLSHIISNLELLESSK